jgi:Uma2 family endonuclease
MSAKPNKQYVSPTEYLAQERVAPFKSEYISGEMIAMAGASDRHEAIASNLSRDLGNALRGKPCRPRTTSNLRVRVRTSSFIYPDALVYCGDPVFDDTEYLDTLLNPTAIFEVLSRSTERFDRFDKSAWYEAIDSLMHYMFISQEIVRVELFTRQSNGDWLKHIGTSLDSKIFLPAISVELALSDLYEDTGIIVGLV